MKIQPDVSSIAKLLTAILCTSAACPAPPAPQAAPGFYVDCKPSENDDAILCMPAEDWKCAYPIIDGEEMYYMRRALCATLNGGTPADYESPELEEIDGESYTNCINPLEYPSGVVGAVGYNNESPKCTDCVSCNYQISRKSMNPTLPGWDELTCNDMPSSCYSCESTESCTTGSDGPTSGSDESGTTEPEPTGGEMHSGIWVCNGSPERCDPMFPGNCMSGDVPDCVYADDTTSRNNCKTLCETKETQTGWNWDCEYFLTSTLGPEELGPNDDITDVCSNDEVMWPEPKPVEGRVTLTIWDGVTPEAAAYAGVYGLIDFEVGACSTTSSLCDVSFEKVVTISSEVIGDYEEFGTLGDLPVAIDGLQITLLQPVLGTVDRLTEQLAFPGDDFFVQITTGAVYLDSTMVSAGGTQVLRLAGGGTLSGSQIDMVLQWEADGLDLVVELRSM